MLSSLIVLFLYGARPASAAVPPSVKGVVITVPGASTPEARSFATQKDRLLLSDYLESTRPGPDHDQMLKTKLERAQRSWLGGDIESARADFRALTELAMKADWKNDQREVIQVAFLRMAQSAESGTEREAWLDSAVRLYGDIDPDATLFPPPLMSEYGAVKQRSTTVSVELADVFPDFRYVLIDGRKVDLALDSRALITSGLHRLTALSDSHESVTEFMTAAQLRVLRVTPPALAEGLCESAKLRSRNVLPSAIDVEIYSGAGCTPKIASALNDSRLVTAPREPFFPETPKTESSSKTWIYVVGGALLAGAAYAVAKQNQSDSAQPTHRSGF
jgi:hypothetical protein